MKRILSFLIPLALILSLAACGAPESPEAPAGTPETPTATSETPSHMPAEPITETMDEEIRRAIAYGLVPEEIQGDYGKPVTFRQYCEMLTNFIRTYDGDSMEAWEKTIALAAESDDEMLREDGILATAFAMVHIGRVEYSGNDWAFFDRVGDYTDQYGYDLTWDYPLFPGWDQTVFEAYNCNYIQGGLTLCAVETSHVSGLAVYPYDFEREGRHFKDKLSREEAIRAVVRFAETEDIYADHIPLPDNIDFSDSQSRMAEASSLAEERRQTILAQTDSAPCTGTAYYISNSGDSGAPRKIWCP